MPVCMSGGVPGACLANNQALADCRVACACLADCRDACPADCRVHEQEQAPADCRVHVHAGGLPAACDVAPDQQPGPDPRPSPATRVDAQGVVTSAAADQVAVTPAAADQVAQVNPPGEQASHPPSSPSTLQSLLDLGLDLGLGLDGVVPTTGAQASRSPPSPPIACEMRPGGLPPRMLCSEQRAEYRAGLVSPGDRIWLKYSDAERSRYIRKHGHGKPWRHSYIVLEVKPHAVKLEVPKDGSVPDVLRWQSLRKCSKAPLHFHDDDMPLPMVDERERMFVPPDREDVGDAAASPNDPVGGAPPPPADRDHDWTTWTPSTRYEIEEVLEARRRGGGWTLTVKWKGYVQTTDEAESRVVRDIHGDPDLLRQIEECKRRYRAAHPEATVPSRPRDAVQDELLDDDDDQRAGDDAEEPGEVPLAVRRPQRSRRKPDTFRPGASMRMVLPYTSSGATTTSCSASVSAIKSLGRSIRFMNKVSTLFDDDFGEFLAG